MGGAGLGLLLAGAALLLPRARGGSSLEELCDCTVRTDYGWKCACGNPASDPSIDGCCNLRKGSCNDFCGAGGDSLAQLRDEVCRDTQLAGATIRAGAVCTRLKKLASESSPAAGGGAGPAPAPGGGGGSTQQRRAAALEAAFQAQAISLAQYELAATALAAELEGAAPPPPLPCVSWRQTGGCDATGSQLEPQNDRPCSASIAPGSSGFCECEGGVKRGMTGCEGTARFTCEAVCAGTPPSDGGGVTDCAQALSCEDCRAADCAWCIGGRKCVEDKPWICAGDTDHIGKIGKVKQCPTTQELDRLWEARREREASAELELQRLRAAAESCPPDQEGGCGADEGAAGAGETDPALAKQQHAEELSRRVEEAAAGKGGKEQPYAVLGVEAEATQGEIRKAYRKLSLRFHPDKNEGSADAQAAFAEIVDAYEILGDPDTRT